MSCLFCAASGGFPWGRKSLSEGCRMNSEIFPSGPVGPKGRFRSSTGSPRRVISGLAEVPPRHRRIHGTQRGHRPPYFKTKSCADTRPIQDRYTSCAKNLRSNVRTNPGTSPRLVADQDGPRERLIFGRGHETTFSNWPYRSIEGFGA
jgi:hypothetical protein